jgi:hypothetical protein
MTQPSAPEVIACPLDDCEWQHTEPVVDVPANTLANVFGFGVMTCAAHVLRTQRVETALSRHFADHKVEEYLRTITRQHDELELAVRLLDIAIDTDDCELDHNQNCQAHMYFPFDQGKTECYQARIKRFVAEHTDTE